MLKVMYNDTLVYKLVIWVFLGVILWTEKEALKFQTFSNIYFCKIFAKKYDLNSFFKCFNHPFFNSDLCLCLRFVWHATHISPTWVINDSSLNKQSSNNIDYALGRGHLILARGGGISLSGKFGEVGIFWGPSSGDLKGGLNNFTCITGKHF